MFWREREREDKEPSGGPPCGQVRVLVVGDSGVGKTSLVHLIVKGSSIARPAQTVGCKVDVKHITYESSGSSSNCIIGDSKGDFFVELWDVSGHERYKEFRSLFYSQVNGVIFVYNLSQRRTKTSLQRWASEVAATGTFSAPLGSGGPGGLPVPYIVIGNKSDIGTKEWPRGSNGNLVGAARQWVEKKGLLPSSEELPLTESFPSTGGLLAAAKESRFDKEAVIKFFRLLIRRRYFPDELPPSNPWSVFPALRPVHLSNENLSNVDHFQTMPRSLSSSYIEEIFSGKELLVFEGQTSQNFLGVTFMDMFFGIIPSFTNLSFDTDKFKMLSPVPDQCPTLYPQQPVPLSENYSIPRFAYSNV